MDWPALFRELVTTYGPAGALAVLAGGALLLPPVRNRIAAALRNGRENGQKATLHHVATLLESHVGETRTEFRLARGNSLGMLGHLLRLRECFTQYRQLTKKPARRRGSRGWRL